MFAKKERKIPGSVMKPHAQHVHLVQTNVLRGAAKNVRVFFPYPGYCAKLKTQDNFLQILDRSQAIREDAHS